MQLQGSLFIGSIVAVVILACPAHGGAACDVAGADAADLADTYAAIETSCPCDVSERAIYLACARKPG